VTAWVLVVCGLGAASGITLIALTNAARTGDQDPPDIRTAARDSGLIRGDDQ
jgi:hypothetical protein